MDSTHQDAVDLAETSVQRAQAVIEQVGPERDGPCPCEGWTVASHAAAAADFFTAFRAADPDGQAPGPLGVPMGMTDQANLRAMDSTLNTWDLAEALGVDHGIDTDQAERVLAFATDFLPRVRDTDAGGHTRFAETSTSGSAGDPLTDLILLSGRRLNWR